jgi:hypothetical protein
MIDSFISSFVKNNTLKATEFVNPRDRKRNEWELTRARFHIRDRFPPKPTRKEKEIGDILSGIISNAPAPEPELPEELASRWPLVVGQQIAKHTEPAYLKAGILHVYADHHGWLTEIRRLPKNHLLKKLSTVPKLPEIKDIRFLLDPSARTWKNNT